MPPRALLAIFPRLAQQLQWDDRALVTLFYAKKAVTFPCATAHGAATFAQPRVLFFLVSYLLVPVIPLPFGSNCFGMRSTVSGQRLAHVDLVLRELSLAVAADVALVAFLRFNHCAFCRHGCLTLRPFSGNLRAKRLEALRCCEMFPDQQHRPYCSAMARRRLLPGRARVAA